MQRVPDTVSADVPNFIDLRVIEMEVDKDRQEHWHVPGHVHQEYAPGGLRHTD